MGIASAILWLVTGFQGKQRLSNLNRRRSLLAGIFLGIHFGCFFGALQNTTIANATLLSTMTPVYTGLIERFLFQRTWHLKIIIGLVLALSGAIIIQGGQFDIGTAHTIGNLLGLAASAAMAVVLMITERIRKEADALIFSRSLYLVGALTMLTAVIISNQQLLPGDSATFLWLILLGIIPTVFGHTIFYYSVKFIPPTVVAAVPLGEPLVASIMGWIILSERVAGATIGGGIIVLTGLFLIVWPRRQIRPV